MKYLELAEIYQSLEKTSKRLEKTYYIAKLLEKTDADDLPRTTLLLQGKVYPIWDERKIGVASRIVIKAISTATGASSEHIEKELNKTGDLGIVAENLVKNKKQSTLFQEHLTVKKVFDNIRKLASMEGQGSVDLKVKTIAQLISSASQLEARYVVRTVLEELRVGVGSGSIRDAIAWAYFPKIFGIFSKCKVCGNYVPNSEKCPECKSPIDAKDSKFSAASELGKANEKETLKISSIDDLSHNDLSKYSFIAAEDEATARNAYNLLLGAVQDAHDLTNDFGEVAKIAKTKGLKGLTNISLAVGTPLKVMLYQKAKDIDDAFDTVGKPAAIEYKYDGFRLNVHRHGKEIKLFTRRLEDVTAQFPDIVDVVRKNIKATNYIVDGEVIGIDPKTKKWLPFQSISQRIKRKYDIEEITKKIPVMLNLFDIMQLNEKNLLKEPFKERRMLLVGITKEVPEKLNLAKQIITAEVKEAEEFYKESLAKGNEGIMVKNLDGIYKPGSRVGYGVKVKPTMESLDLVIVGAEWGEGKRAKWLTSFILACRDDETGELLEIGKVGTGIKELEGSEGVTFEELTNLLKPLVKSESGKAVKVKPEIVVEVTYEEIQKSPTYSSGYALRFPRLLRLRAEDKPVDEASTLLMVEELFRGQK